MYEQPKRKVCYLLDPSILDEVEDNDTTEEVDEQELNKAALFAEKQENERKQS
jgi:hypothetical protein